jgi:hypothetical protein
MVESHPVQDLHVIDANLLLCFLLLIVACNRVCALRSYENHGLVVTGSVHKVEAKCEEGKPLFAVHLSLQIRNDSASPLVFIGGPGISTDNFNFYYHSPGSQRKRSSQPKSYDTTHIKRIRLARGSPAITIRMPAGQNPERWEDPEPLIPGGYWNAPGKIWLTSGFTLSEKSYRGLQACKPVDETPIPDYPSFYVEHRTSLKKYPNGENAMRSLQERWKSIGLLPLDSSGDISYRSESIIFPK